MLNIVQTLELALDALECIPARWRWAEEKRITAITAIKEALEAPTPAEYAKGYAEGFNDGCRPAQPTTEDFSVVQTVPMQEPIECMCGICKLGQRPWVGLTDEEIQTIHDTYYRRMGPMEFAVMLEQRLKEKNT